MSELRGPSGLVRVLTVSVSYEELRSEVARLAAVRGVSDGTAAMFLMTLSVMAMARHIPEPLRPGLVEASARWFAGLEGIGSLQPARVACWKYLEAKNGNSTSVTDKTDVAVRGLICVLWDHADEGDDLEAGLEFFAQLVDPYGGLEATLGLC
jgi:hypothetical protein